MILILQKFLAIVNAVAQLKGFYYPDFVTMLYDVDINVNSAM